MPRHNIGAIFIWSMLTGAAGFATACEARDSSERTRDALDFDIIDTAFGDSDATLDGNADTDSVETCFQSTLPITDPRHRYRHVRVVALQPGVRIDSVQLFEGGNLDCVLTAVEISDISRLDDSAPQILYEPDGVLDGSPIRCDEELAALLLEAGDYILVKLSHAVAEGDVIEVREATSCAAPSDGPQFRVEVLPFRLEPGIVLGDGAGPISRLTVPMGFYEVP